MKTKTNTVWKNKIDMIDKALNLLASGECYKRCMATAGLSHESTGFSDAILSSCDAKTALEKAKRANENGLVNHLNG